MVPAESPVSRSLEFPEDSLLLKLAADGRSMGSGPSLGLLQLLHPAIRTAVEHHSAFSGEPFQRVIRSIPLIWATLLLPDGKERAVKVRDLHTKIGGDLPDGNRYHALAPETFWWAHACFTWGIFRSVEVMRFRQLTDEQKERLYQETVVWYRRYGVSDRPVPPDYPAFCEKFDRICAEDLELTPALRDTVDHGTNGIVASSIKTLGPLGVLAIVLAPMVNALVIGCLPLSVRERFFTYRWTPWRRTVFFLTKWVGRIGLALVPPSLNRAALRFMIRLFGSRTRHDRYVVPA